MLITFIICHYTLNTYYFITESVYLLTAFNQFPFHNPLPLITKNLISIFLWICFWSITDLQHYASSHNIVIWYFFSFLIFPSSFKKFIIIFWLEDNCFTMSYCFLPYKNVNQSSVQFSRSVMSKSLQPYGLLHTRPPCPSPTPGAYSDSVSDVIQTSHLLSSPSPPTFSLT